MNRRSFLKWFGASTAAAVPAVVIDKQEEEKVAAHAFLEMCDPETNLKEFREWSATPGEEVRAAYHLGVRDALYAAHNYFDNCQCEEKSGYGCHPDMHKAAAQILKLMRKRSDLGAI